jgi:hypothetical protein
MSTNTSVAPASTTALAAAAKLNDGTMTSSPGQIPTCPCADARTDVRTAADDALRAEDSLVADLREVPDPGTRADDRGVGDVG